MIFVVPLFGVIGRNRRRQSLCHTMARGRQANQDGTDHFFSDILHPVHDKTWHHYGLK
jgi:hypothetical protein